MATPNDDTNDCLSVDSEKSPCGMSFETEIDLTNHMKMHGRKGEEEVHLSANAQGLAIKKPKILPLQDREDIIKNQWLSDIVIDTAQTLIKELRPDMGGLFPCGGVGFMDPLAVNERFIQVMNTAINMNPATIDYSVIGGQHWIVISNEMTKDAN